MSAKAPRLLAQIIVTLCVPIILIASPLFVLFRPAYARFQYSLPSFPASMRFELAERSRLSDTILRYMTGDGTLDEMATMRTDDGTTALLPSETQHLVDVKGVVQGFQKTARGALVLGLLAGLYLIKKSLSAFVLALKIGLGMSLGFLVVLGLAAAIDFDQFFTLFHGVFFESGTWTFFYEDTLIQLYPLPFWTNAFLHLFSLMAALGAVVYGIAQAANRQLRARADT